MNGSLVLLNLAGAVALLLWATRMVRTGVERAYGDRLRRRLATLLQSPLAAIAAGLVLAVALQSSTAVGLLVGSFVGSGIITGAAGVLSALGADIGSSLVVKLLSFDLSELVPLAILLGTTIFLVTERREWRQFGRILVGVGLLLLSLRLIGQSTEPLRDSRILPLVVNYLSGDPVTAFLIAAVMTWLFHSSVAAILLIATLATRGLMPVELGVVMVLGANLGGSVIATVLTRASTPLARVVPLGNLLVRGPGAIIALLVVMLVPLPFARLGGDPAGQIVNAHILFNCLIVLAGAPFAGFIYRSALQIVLATTPAAREAVAEVERVSALDEHDLDRPEQALANATREVVGICETIDVMLQRIIELYEHPDKERIAELAALDDEVDRRHAATKLYLTRAATRPMTERQRLRCEELVGACVKLEQVGDIVVRNMLPQVKKKLARDLEFTEEGWQELCAFHRSVLADARLAFNLLVSRDYETARQLIVEKDRLRELEKETNRRHFARLGEGTTRSLETSSIHLDTIRDLKQINSLLAAIAYPALEEQGLLHGSRLRKVGTESGPSA